RHSIVVLTQSCSITLAAPIPIDSDTTIDAQGHTVTLSAGDASRVFEVSQAAGTFKLLGITVTAGTDTNGGAMFIDSGSIVVLSNCTFTGNSIVASNGVAGTNG